MKFNQLSRKMFRSFLLTAAFGGLLAASSRSAFAQFTFVGDYDRTNFAAPNGYFVEPQNNFPQDTINPARRTYLFTGDYAPDGSVIAGGRIEKSSGGDFWLRKFTASGAPDASFGGGTGYVRTVFSTEFTGAEGNSLPSVLKRQSDGKIIFGGVCDVQRDQANSGANGSFGLDWCLVRYNADGSIDNSFGNNIVQWSNGPNITYSQAVGPGRVATQTNTRDSGLFGGAGLSARLSDMAIQPDGKIVAVGYTRSETRGAFDPSGYLIEGIVIRYNANGSLDTTFGLNGSGIARFSPSNSGTASSPCYGQRNFYGIRLQPDGRIIAVGYDGVGVVSGGCSAGGTFFVVTRWTANGQLETVRRLDANTNVFSKENAVAALITNDGGKLLVSGSYQGTEALVRFNLSDLTIDTTFGTNGVVNYPGSGPETNRMYIKAIQPDGKILGVDYSTLYQVFRLNPNGSPDNSFGNQLFYFMNPNVKGRADLPVFTINNTAQISLGHILLRPNGKFNLIGSGTANLGGASPRALVSQNINSIHSNTSGDFTNDGKSEIAVFRPSTGVWHQLDSASGAYSTFGWGIATDKLAPADYDGDGKTDRAVFRNGTWYIFQSFDSQVRTIQWGTAGDAPVPADYDGDGYADIAVFRAGTWYIIQSSNNQVRVQQWGNAGDIPLLGDFDGDGKADISVFRNGIWYIFQSSNNQARVIQWGITNDIPLVGDYDGDSKADFAVFRAGIWYILRSGDGSFFGTNWGASGDKPVPADFDNDGKTDLAVYRGGTWYALPSGGGAPIVVNFGLASDLPIQAAYLP